MKAIYLTTDEAREVHKGSLLQVVKEKHPRVKASDTVFVKEKWAPGTWVYPHNRFIVASQFMDCELKYDFDRREHTQWCKDRAFPHIRIPSADCPACEDFRWRPPVTIPREATRLLLHITTVTLADIGWVVEFTVRWREGCGIVMADELFA